MYTLFHRTKSANNIPIEVTTTVRSENLDPSSLLTNVFSSSMSSLFEDDRSKNSNNGGIDSMLVEMRQRRRSWFEEGQSGRQPDGRYKL